MLKKMMVVFLFFIVATTTDYIYAHGNMHLGRIDFPTSGQKDAQRCFENGIMLLHSFEYDEARLEFQQAEKKDPEFAMAYWGEAMTYNHPIWGEQDAKAALRVLNRLAKTAALCEQKAVTPKERGLMKAIHILYGEGNKKSRDLAYAEQMRILYRQNPNDDEIASFYALALLGTAETERDFKIYMRAAGVADEIFNRNPLHPGALHYAIHSYDDPIHAPLGLRAARSYAKIAPDASHALHMPSHIFMAMGMWEDVISSNKAAWEAGVKQNPTSIASKFTIDDLHALQWLSYGYLQIGKYPLAYQLTKRAEKIAIESRTPMATWYYSVMRAAYILATRDYQSPLRSIDMIQMELSARASQMYINALIEMNKHNASGMNKAKSIYAELLNLIPPINARQNPIVNFFVSSLPSGIYNAKIMALELSAQILLKEGKLSQALAELRKANVLEAKMSFGYGPPMPVQPSYELLAGLLVKQKKYTEAYHLMISALNRMPNRIESHLLLRVAQRGLHTQGLPVPAGNQSYFNKLMLPDYYQ